MKSVSMKPLLENTIRKMLFHRFISSECVKANSLVDILLHFVLFILLIGTSSCDTHRQNIPDNQSIVLNYSASKEWTAQTWRRTRLREVGVMDFETLRNGKILAATTAGLFISQNDGKDWKLTGNEFLQGKIVTCLARNPKYILAGVEGKGVYRSEDNGESWQLVSRGLTPPSTVVKDLAYRGKTWFAATDRGVFVSNNNGEIWFAANKGLARLEVIGQVAPRVCMVNNLLFIHSDILALTETGIAISSDKGASWHYIRHEGIANPGLISCFTANRDVVYAGRFMRDGVYSSADEGDTWVKVGLEGKNLCKVFISPNGIMYAGTAGDGVYRSYDGGKDWSAVKEGLPEDTDVLAFASTVSGTILAGTDKFGVFRLE